MRELRANTEVIVIIGPFVDVGDGFTPETGIDLATADEAELLKHGSTTVVDISAATWAAVTGADGHYGLTLTTTHTNAEGLLRVIVQDDSVCLPVMADFMVLSEAAWDSKYVAKDDGFMDVNIKTVGRADTQETEATNLEAACAAYSATRGLSGTALPAAAADAAGGLPISDAGGIDLDAQIVTKINDILTDTGTTLQAEVDGIQADTEDIQSRLPAALVNSRMDSTVDATGMESGATDNIKAALGLVIASGTIGSTGNDTTHLHLTGLPFDDDELNNYLIMVRDVSATEYHSRWISDWANAGDLATLGAALPFTPENAVDTYVILSIRQDVTGGSGLDAAGVRAAIGMASANLDTQLADIETKVDDVETRMGTPSDLGGGATLAANLSDIEAQTDDIGAAGAGLTALATAAELAKVPKSDSNVTWNATAAAQLQTEANDALVANHLDHLIGVADPGGVVANSSFLAKLTSKSATPAFSSYDNTSDSLEAIADGAAGGGATAEEVWEYADRQLTAFNFGGKITVTLPVADGGPIEIYRGLTYLIADGISVRLTSAAWPTLTAATVTMYLYRDQEGPVWSKAMTVTTGTGTKIIDLELTAAQSIQLSGHYRYVIMAILSSGSTVRLASDTFTAKNQ